MAVTWLLLAFLGVCNAQYFDWDVITALDEYVHRDDGFFDLGEPIDTFYEDGATVYLFNMTSQQWMTDGYTDRSIWWHHFAVAIPSEPRILDAAHLFVEGGNNGDDGDHPDMGTGRMQYIADFANEVGAVAALLRQNPNQPCHFADSPNVGRTEDMIIARTWRHYIEAEEGEEHDDTDIILQLPMTKAAKVAVDALIDFSASINPDFEIDKVMPSGFSKRGWVAWLLACVDQRVFATAPIVLDLLNWHENLHHHNQAYGGWSWAFFAYWNEEVSRYIDHPTAAEVFDDIAIDPIRYNIRMDGMPKLISSATGDQFFLPDDSHYYFEELSGPKFLSIHENDDHNLGRPDSTRVDANLVAFFEAAYRALDGGFQWPEIEWERIETETDGTIMLQTEDVPLSITAFWADTTNVTCQVERNFTTQPETCRRDFRMRALNADNPIWWEEVPVEDHGNGEYSVTFDTRDAEEGYRGFVIQMTFPGAREGDVLDVTTDVHIIPDTFPFPRCQTEEECRGVLK